MTWIESHQELARHPKTKKLARALKVSIPAAIGHLHLIWWWAMDYAQDGDLSGFALDDIREAAMWTKKGEDLIAGLQEAGFLDGMQIHDWDVYAGNLIARRAANAERMRQARAAKGSSNEGARASHVQTTDDARAQNVRSTSGTRAGLPYPTVPDQPYRTVPDQPNQPDPDTAAPAAFFQAPSSDEEILDAVATVFTERGFTSRLRTDKQEQQCALELVRDGYAPQDLVGCWADIREGRYSNSSTFAREHLSFKYLAGMNRIGNWRVWRDQGKPAPSSSNGHGRQGPKSHAEYMRDPDRFKNDPVVQAGTRKFLEGRSANAPAPAE